MIEKEKAAPTGNGNINTHAKIIKKLPYRKSSAVKILERLADEDAKAKFPDLPGVYGWYSNNFSGINYEHIR